MNAKECYSIVEPELLTIKGFSKMAKSKSSYSNKEGYLLEFVLNKYGYIESEGWSFLLRLTDPRVVDEYGVVDYNGQTKFDGLWLKNSVSKEIFTNLYRLEYDPTRKLIEDYDMWIPFRNGNHLKEIITTIIPFIQTEISIWLSTIKERPLTNQR